MKRRTFVGRLAAGLAASRVPGAITSPHEAQSGRALRVLVLGGTTYVGPSLIREARAAGHEVTMFNRGYHRPDAFPTVERLVGNRFPDRGDGLRALEGSREWDLVIDTWSRAPGCVHVTASLLRDRAARYVYVSSVAALGSFRAVGLDESSPTVDAAEHTASWATDLGYAIDKRAAELAVLDAFGDRATILRCSGIWGDDPFGAQLSYWGLRFLSGEPFLVPDDRTARVQWTDVRDIGRFSLHAAERDLGGVFHLFNTPEPIPLWDVLQAWHRATGGRGRMVPADRTFMDAHGLRPWVDIPHYIPDDDPEPGFYRVRGDRAHRTGFRFRGLAETVADEARSVAQPVSPALAPRGELDRVRELRLVEALLR
jgi:2'-hydroxyisoflavone reductase